MPEERAGPETFLAETHPALSLLQEAVAQNHRDLYILTALAGHGEAHQAEDVAWTYAGPEGESMILFPRLTEAEAGERLDALVEFYRDRRPEMLVGCWSLDPPQPPDLDVRLLARGFQTGWRPRWMWLDIARMQPEYPWPDGLTIEMLESEADWAPVDLPYYSREKAAVRQAMTRLAPGRLWYFAARLNGKPVGHSTLFLTAGPLGVAGIYGVGVAPAARNRGIGKAVTRAACRHAQAMGCRHALLNGTGERMYRQIGFERIGDGWTWWLNVARLESRPPTRERIALVEAVGRGDREALASLGGRFSAEELDAPLPNGMTLMELAVHADQPASAEWLVARGATLDVLSAWDLGWKERVPQLLADRPELANQRLGERQITPLHAAVERNDIELARQLLAAGPNLEIEDPAFHSTPLGWARHLQRTELIHLMEQHRGPG